MKVIYSNFKVVIGEIELEVSSARILRTLGDDLLCVD